ncbi:MAG: hypothetical protein ACOXZT_08775 [Tissierellaceae bacterium]|mgnify:CR=1 FL=1|jgi:uncharacterized membrane protein YgdD (TMEM256/DUF423 family)
MTMKIGKVTKVGIIIQIMALVTMLVLVLLNKTVPSLLSWIFLVGLVIVMSGSLVTLSKRNQAI